MKIKEICEKTGLTDKAVRYYIEEKLITPFYTENYLGRKSFDFSEQDLAQLQNISTLRAFGFSIEEIKQLCLGQAEIGQIVEAVKKRTGECFDESRRRLDVLSSLELSDQVEFSKLAQKLSSFDPTIKNEPPVRNLKKRFLSLFRSCTVFLAVWLPIVSAIMVLILKGVTLHMPIVRPSFFVYTLLCFFPSMVTVLAFQRLKGSRRMLRILLTTLCVFCLPLSVFFSSKSVIVCDHQYQTYRTVAQATCQSEGEEIVRCTVCGNFQTQRVEKLSHVPVVVKGFAPTCFKVGLSEGSNCSLCNMVLSAQITLPVTNIHTPVMDAARAADCENVGLSEGSHCLDCGKVLVEQITSPALGHMYTHQIVEPTCGEGGYTVHQCGCGSIYIDNYTRETVYHEFVEYSTSPSKSVCKACGLKVVSHGNADGTAFGGNDSVKYYLTGADTFSYGKTLVIYGSGDMPDYIIDNPPWSYFKDQIKTIIIEEGITSIGEDAFSHEKYSNTGKLIIRSKHLANINIKKNFAGISEILCEIIFDY